MAFNPFHHFRRYSKVVFAGLAILCMVTFVLSSGMGRGDMLTQLTNWASGGGGRGTEVLTLYGKKFDGPQVRQIQVGRQMASEYMLAVIEYARRNVVQRATDGVAKMSEGPARSLAQRAVQMRQFMQFGPQFADQYRNMVRDPRFRSQLLQAIETAESQKKLEDKATLEAVFKMLALDSEAMDRPQNEGYFGGQFTGNVNYEEVADYLIWLHQADKLGIQLNREAIDATIARETYGDLTAENARDIDRFLRERFGRDGYYSVDTLYQVLGDELRVRLAKAALTGESAKVRSAIPGGILTPEEMWDLYKDARMTVQVGMLEVPVRPFLSQVTATPTEDELRKLYEKYRTQEPTPFSETPGFKEPRKIQVEWLTADPKLPFYEQAAAKVAPLATALAQIGGATGGVSGGSVTGVAEIMHTAAPFVFPDVMLASQLEEYHRRESRRLWTDNFRPELHDSSVVRPENVAVLVGATAGAWGTGAPPLLTAPLAFEGKAISREVIDRAEIGTAIVGLAAVDSIKAGLLGQPLPLSILGIPFARVPKPLSVDILRPQLREKAHEALARSLMQEDLRAFTVEVTKLGKEKDKDTVNKYIEEFVKTRGLAKGGTTEPRDVWGLRDDPGLTPLKEAYAKVAGLSDPLLQAFGLHLFQDQMMTFMGQPAKDIEPYSPHEFLGRADGDRAIYFWKTEDRDARIAPFDKARPKVEAAWKELEARKLAQKEAERLAVEAKAGQGDRQKLLDLAAQSNREYFELGPMARFMPQPTPNPLPGQFRQYTMLDRDLFKYPPDKITYPTAELQRKILDLRKDPKGTTVVGSDMPKNHFYVISLLQREEPTPEEFRNSYVHSMVTSTEFDPILAILANDRRAAYRNDVLKELRAEANLLINREARERRSRDEDVTEQ
jgi:hypothetical protein